MTSVWKMIPWWVWVMFGLAMVLKIAISALNSPKRKGRIGERRVATRLLEGLGDEYEILNDVYLPSREGETTQVDHVVVSPYGIFVVETKNWTGWIFGDADSVKWTQCVYRKKNSFQNPLRQNYKHICELSRNLGIEQKHIHSVIAITGDCTFKTAMPDCVVFSRDAASYIKSSVGRPFSSARVTEVVNAIRALQSTISDSQKSAHVANLRRRH